MIEVGLEFEVGIGEVLQAISQLPAPVRPVHYSKDESAPVSPRNVIADEARFKAFVAASPSGFFLLGPQVTYSLRVAQGKPLLCDGFLEVSPAAVWEFMQVMAMAGPTFGFACAPGERERSNRVVVLQGANRIESWVGRDTSRCVPGLYWLTLLPEALAARHGVPLDALAAHAAQHLQPGAGIHLFRFYENPQEWQQVPSLDLLRSSLPGVFDITALQSSLQAAKNFLELNSLLRKWK